MILQFVVRMVKRTEAIASSLRHLAGVQRQGKVLSIYAIEVLVKCLLLVQDALLLLQMILHFVVRMEKRTTAFASSIWHLATVHKQGKVLSVYFMKVLVKSLLLLHHQ
jgi:hypothetical protein